MYPSPASWENDNDRAVDCLQESYGLSVINPEKLNRLVRYNSLVPNECFDDAPEAEGYHVELVSCSDDWENQVSGTFVVDSDQPYPGVDYLFAQADRRCPDAYNSLVYPSVDSWAADSRQVICIVSASE